jgi:DNA-binding GntR family transcriptional regulator
MSKPGAPTQSDRVFETLRADILACRVLPGSKLRINDLTETLQVSLGAVREALSRLGAEGLVIAESQRGYRVTPLSVSELRDLTDARVEIERVVLTRSIARGDLEWETGLVGAWHRLSRIDERVADDARRLSDPWVVAHASFHDALVSACGSIKLLQIRSQLYEQSERYRRYSAPLAKTERNVALEHQQIFQASIERKSSEAVGFMTEHLMRTAAIIITSPLLDTEDAFDKRRV